MARLMKDSGIEWIGDIPDTWNTCRHKDVMHKEKNICDHYNGEDIISLTMNGVIIRDLDAGGKMPTTFDGYQYVEPEDLLLCLFDIDVTPRCVGLVRNYGLTSPAYSRFKVHNGFYNAYYDYLLRAIDDKKVFVHLAKNLRSSLTESDFGVLPTIAPPFKEQKSIVSFLDTECSRIDSVVEQTRASIEEYKKLKQAVITQAVTKGIRPNREMKDSGIDVIKYLPSDWYVYAIKHLCSQPITDGTHLTPDYSDAENGSPFLSSKDISTGYIDWKNIKYITKELHVELQKRIAPQFEDILLAKNGTTGIAAIVESNKTFDVYVTIAVIRVDKQRVLPKFLLYSINSLLCKHQFDEHLKGIGVPNLHLGTINNTKVFLPSIEEQKLIVLYLDEKISKLDLLIKKKTLLLDTLESYKKSLIFEYVTGKKEVI